MATARHLHPLTNPVVITISPTGTITNAQGFQSVADGTQIEFSNTASIGFNLVFTAVFGTISAPAQSTTTPPISASEVGVSYVIKRADNGAQTGGPYAIQWGNGALEVSIASATPDNDPVAVPLLGNIHFTAADSSYTIVWKDKNNNTVTIWNQQASKINKSPTTNPVQKALPQANGPYTYTLTATNNVPGKGTVHVGSGS